MSYMSRLGTLFSGGGDAAERSAMTQTLNRARNIDISKRAPAPKCAKCDGGDAVDCGPRAPQKVTVPGFQLDPVSMGDLCSRDYLKAVVHDAMLNSMLPQDGVDQLETAITEASLTDSDTSDDLVAVAEQHIRTCFFGIGWAAGSDQINSGFAQLRLAFTAHGDTWNLTAPARTIDFDIPLPNEPSKAFSAKLPYQAIVAVNMRMKAGIRVPVNAMIGGGPSDVTPADATEVSDKLRSSSGKIYEAGFVRASIVGGAVPANGTLQVAALRPGTAGYIQACILFGTNLVSAP